MEIIILHSTTLLPPILRFHEMLSKGAVFSFRCFNSYIIINKLLVPLRPDDIHTFAKRVTIYRTREYTGPLFSWNATKDLGLNTDSFKCIK